MWCHMRIIKDGERIVHIIEEGTLIIVHNGSYMLQIVKFICQSGIVLLCSPGCMGTIKTGPMIVSNYIGVLLGALIASHILSIASDFSSSNKTVHLHYDNLGVIHHASHSGSPGMTSKHSQTYLLSSYAIQVQLPSKGTITVYTATLMTLLSSWIYPFLNNSI